MEQRNKPEMDVQVMLLEQALRERVDAAFERLRNGTAVYLSHSEAEKRMALFKGALLARGVRGLSSGAGLSGFVGRRLRYLPGGFEREADTQDVN
ncbi:hypothetical protein ACI2JW_22175 [Serratia ureilytica]|uniref:hypothetical protein n=1 Tax=Serratia TaxID=613 RepID=UPI0018D7412E|nr:hypothetical protein [Serratia ureilytica]MBH2926800.1 hypothetical protein [Serratia ureilytica]